MLPPTLVVMATQVSISLPKYVPKLAPSVLEDTSFKKPEPRYRKTVLFLSSLSVEEVIRMFGYRRSSKQNAKSFFFPFPTLLQGCWTL